MPVSLLKSGWSSGNLIFQKRGSGATTGIHFGIDGTGIDIKFFGDTASSYMLWDQSADQLVFDAADIQLGDSDYLKFGDASGGDVSVNWTGSVLQISPAVDDTGSINIGDGTTDIDFKVFLNASTKYVVFDVGDSLLKLEDVDLKLGDNDILQFGDASGGDVSVKWNAANLVILPAVDDTGAIYFGDGTTDMDVRFTLGASTDYVEFNVGNKALEFVGLAKVDIGSSGTPLVLTAGTPIFELYSTCASAGGTNAEPFYVKSTMTGAGGIGARSRFDMYTNVALGSYSNALKAYTEYGATGSTTGLGTAFVGELVLSAGTSSGTYAPLESELVLGSGASTGTASSFLYMNTSGDGKATFDTNGYLFEIGDGITANSGKLYDTSATAATGDATLKIRIGGVTKYLLVADDAS